MTHKPEVMSGESLDIAAQRRDELKQLFPGVFTETKDADGNVVSTIDFERLKAELGTFSDIYEGRRERYGMEWPGKRDCMKVIQEPSRATLKPCPDESVDWDTTKNLFIEGDNLEVLKLLQKSYYGKVKTIYIDPPYNTGNEFIYPDNYQETLEHYLEFAGLKDDLGKINTTNTKSEGRYHSKWMSMMFPRLFLARNLLTEDGIICISIDDNEHSNLRNICNDVFGEENFMGEVCRSTGQTTGQDSGGLGSSFDYLLVYAKSAEFDLSGLPLTDKDLTRFENEDKRGKFAFDQMRKTGSNDRREDRPKLFYPVKDPDGNDCYPIAPAGYESCWRFEKKKYEQLEKDDYILWRKSKRGDSEIWWPYVKYYLEGRTKRPSPLWNDIDGNKKAARDVRALFDGNKVFDFPKPVQLIERCIQISPNAGKQDLILDFFAGSGTTAEAVMSLNAKDGGNRKFIIVQLPEPCPKESIAYKLGYRKISDVTKERVKRAFNKHKSGSTTHLDNGFRAFSLDKTCFKEWGAKGEQTIEQVQAQLDLSIINIVSGKTQDDILFEILLKAGFEPTESIESIHLNGKIVYSVANRALLICLEEQLTAELIDEVIALEPMQFICLDKGFQGNDQLKANTAQLFKARSQDSEAEMVFKVV